MDILGSILSHPATAPHNLGVLVQAGQAIVGTLLIPFFVATSPGREMAAETHALPQQHEQQIELEIKDPQKPWADDTQDFADDQ